jgi:membrane-associated phospholipid phosphatase
VRNAYHHRTPISQALPLTDISIPLDPFAVAVGTGLLTSVVAGRGLVYGLDQTPRQWRKTAEWSLVGGAAVVVVLGDLLSTLYTKQHYAVDVIAGALIAGLADLTFLRGYPLEAVDVADRRLAPRRALGVVAIYGTLIVLLWVVYVSGLVVV